MKGILLVASILVVGGFPQPSRSEDVMDFAQGLLALGKGGQMTQLFSSSWLEQGLSLMRGLGQGRQGNGLVRMLLSSLLSSSPALLGPKIRERFGDQLPYLFKVLQHR